MSIENMLVKERTKEQWLNYCWMRGYSHEQASSIIATHSSFIVTKEEYSEYELSQQKAMDAFFDGFSDEDIKEIGSELFGIKK